MSRHAIVVLGVSLLASCGSGEPPTAASPEQVDPAAHAAHSEHAEHEARATSVGSGETGGLALTLDDGKKWPMDEHTRVAFGEIRRIVTAAEITSGPDATTIGSSLDAELSGLISGCTMTGAAHDQLHVFLTAFMPAVKSLTEADTVAAAQEELSRLRHLVEVYDAHFE